MTAYEIMLLLDPELAEERQNEILGRARALVLEAEGLWQRHEPWGRRKLAYEIGKRSEAYYHLLLFDAEPSTLAELTRVLKITDGVMRLMAVRRPEASRLRPAAGRPPSAVRAPE